MLVAIELMEDGTAMMTEKPNGKLPKKSLVSDGANLAIIGLGFWGLASILLVLFVLFKWIKTKTSWSWKPIVARANWKWKEKWYQSKSKLDQSNLR